MGGVGRRAGTADPARAGFAVTQEASVELIIGEVVKIGKRGDFGQGLGQFLSGSARKPGGVCEVDLAAVAWRYGDEAVGAFYVAGLYIGAAPDLAADEPAPARLGIGPRHGTEGHAQVVGEIALRGKFIAGGE